MTSRYLTKAAALIAGSCAVMAAPLAAQDQDSVDAVASLELADPPAVINGVRNLDFGRVTILRGLRSSETRCRYTVTPGAGGSDITNTIVTQGSSDIPGNPTLGGCRLSGTPTTAEFRANCNLNGPLNVAVSYTNPIAGGANWIGLTRATSSENGTSEFFNLQGAGGAGGKVFGSFPCTTARIVRIWIGGTFEVWADATPTENLPLATITLEAVY